VRQLQKHGLRGTVVLVVVITNMLHPHLLRVVATVWLLPDNILTETTPKAADCFLANMHVLTELRGDLRLRYPVSDGKMIP
jgi:hypothetical protein